MLSLLEITAALLYLAGSWQLHSNKVAPQYQTLILLIVPAVALQGLAIGLSDMLGAQWKLDVGAALKLFLWQCCAVHALLSTRQPLWHLGRWLWPMTALAIPLAWLLPAGAAHSVPLDAAIRTHIILSLLAYATLTLAALQTMSYATLERSLRQPGHRTSMPPLQVMEDLVFRLVTIGFVLLCTSIASGFLFVDDFFAQHLAHKTVLSLIACALFGALAAGRQLRGWRGRTAVRWVLWAYITLLLAYFGSKLVLELLLGRSWA
ncbi:MAG: cytochrome C assembly family protein [Oceanococcus sp.]